MNNIYSECTTYDMKLITLRQTKLKDAKELLKCYSDEKAVPLFNSDNCHGDNFYYETMDRMEQAVKFWEYSYKNRYFVRWSVINNSTNEIIGTIEMFHRNADDKYDHYGVLRIDLQSRYETREIISEILEIASENFYEIFDVRAIITKAVPEAVERIIALMNCGYKPTNEKLLIYDDYYVRFCE